MVVVRWAVQDLSTRDWSTLQRRLLPHAQTGSRWIVQRQAGWRLGSIGDNDEDVDRNEQWKVVLDATLNLGLLYADQGKLAEAEQMYERALRGYEEALGDIFVQQYLPALNTTENLGSLYAQQGQSIQAREMYSKAFSGLQSILGQSSDRCRRLASKMHALPTPQLNGEERIQLLAVQEAPEVSSQQKKKAWRLALPRRVKTILQRGE